MLIDSHAHLEMVQFQGDLPQVLSRAAQAGVAAIITIGSDLPSSRRAMELAQEHDNLYAAVGVHPHEAQGTTPDTFRALQKLALNPKIVAIGECGLDYYRFHSPANMQRDAFIKQIKLANRLALPLIIHNRQAEKDLLQTLKAHPADKKGVIHCFSGDKNFLRTCLDLGYYISFSGTVTFPKAEELRELVKLVPSDKLLIETDCPYLSPAPWRGKRNEPAHLTATAEKIAALRNLGPGDVARITSVNTRQLFELDGVDAEGVIAYPIRDSLYLNITNDCTNNCVFCARQKSFFVQGHNLRLQCEPLLENILSALPALEPYREVVFCGFGEPLLRLRLVREAARHLKKEGKRIRINTNGQGNLIHERDIVPELAPVVDELSISLNAPTSGQYQQLCQSRFGDAAFGAVLDFARLSLAAGLQVTLTALDMPGIDLQACRDIAAGLGAGFRVRDYNIVG